MDTASSILQSAKHFFFGTLLSRFSGLLRDIVMAACFGATAEVAAFMVAYRLANLFRRLLGEGNVAAGFTPLYVHHRQEQTGSSFYRDVAWSMGFVLIGAVAILELFLYFLSGWVGAEWEEILSLSMWMVPGLFFICLFALHTALLQCQKKAFWSGVAPVAFNFAWIVIALSTRKIEWLAIGITAAYGMQWLLTASQVRKELGSWSYPTLFSPEWRSMLKPMGLGLLGVGAMQINSALDAIFARIADPSGPALLWYAIRIQQLPLALFGIALSGALLAPLARASKEGNSERYRELLNSGLRNVIALMVPASFALFALGRSGVNLLYGHGSFSGVDVDATTVCLWAYGLGLVPAVLVLILAQGFYAKKSYGIPTFGSVVAVVVNTVLNGTLVFGLGWGAASIALATSLSSVVNYMILARALELPSLLNDRFFWRLIAASAAPAVCSFWVQTRLLPVDSRDLFAQLLHFGVGALVYFGGVFLMAHRFKISELFDVMKVRS